MDPKKDTWTKEDKLQWLAKQKQERSYPDQVLARVHALAEKGTLATMHHYGNLTLQDSDGIRLADKTLGAEEYEKRYPLYCFQVGDPANGKPNVIVTGGTHGYEESGVYGALEFLEKDAETYSTHFNFLVFPCVSPFSFEINQRWTHDAWDPNRSFDSDKPYVPEARLVMDVVEKARKENEKDFILAVDLHETPDRDRVIMPLQYARYGIQKTAEDMQIPNGYYLIAHAENKDLHMSRSIIEAVDKVTTIAPDEKIGGIQNDGGVVTRPFATPIMAGLNASFMKRFTENTFTTEIYPEIHPSPRGEQEAIAAQRATVKGALDHISKAG